MPRAVERLIYGLGLATIFLPGLIVLAAVVLVMSIVLVIHEGTKDA